MTATAWSKFFWADWLADANLRRCSAAARGVWMDMLCVAAQQTPVGFLSANGEPLSPSDVARIGALSEAEAAALIGELERNGVFSRDRKGRIYSRRMVRDERKRRCAAKNGSKGGNPSLLNQTEISPPDKGEVKAGVKPISQSPRSKTPEAKSPGSESPADSASAAIARAAKAMGATAEALQRKPGWLRFGEFLGEIASQGCDLERDVWPAIERVSARAKRMPDTPHYFRAAILEARDARLGGHAPKAASAAEHADRLAVFERHGVWSSQWGPKPSGD